MTNLEKYKDFIEEHIKDKKLFGIINGVPRECVNISHCYMCEFHYDYHCVACDIFSWLFKEAEEEPYYITKEELSFCKMVHIGYLWRDLDNNLFYCKEKLKKSSFGNYCYSLEHDSTIFLNPLVFPPFKFVKNELISIKDILNNYTLL